MEGRHEGHPEGARVRRARGSTGSTQVVVASAAVVLVLLVGVLVWQRPWEGGPPVALVGDSIFAMSKSALNDELRSDWDVRTEATPGITTVGQVGPIRRDTLIQAKGREYTLKDFLVDDQDARDFEGGVFATLYLAPYNYHRIHTPLAGEITGYSYIPGHLWPVNAAGVAEIDKLFAVNERLITFLQTNAGKVAVVKVGATCVGRIRALYDDVVTNSGRPPAFSRVRYPKPIQIDKAAECGIFEMGSTVILLFEKNRVSLTPNITTGSPIRLGQPLARVISQR